MTLYRPCTVVACSLLLVLACTRRPTEDYRALSYREAFRAALADTGAPHLRPSTLQTYRWLDSVAKAADRHDSIILGGRLSILATDDYLEDRLLEVVLESQRTLAALGYGTTFSGRVDTLTRLATSNYEQARRLLRTGNPLSPPTVQALRDDRAILDRPFLGAQRSVYISDALAVAQGILASTDSVPVLSQYMGVSLTCQRSLMECTQVSADQALNIHSETYHVLSWTSTQLIATKDFPCARYTLNIDGPSKTLVSTRATLRTSGECSFMSVDPLRSVLLDGPTITTTSPTPGDLIRWGPRVDSARHR